MLKKLAILSLIVVGMMAFGDDNDTFNVKLEESVVTATGFDDVQSNQIKNTTIVTAQDIHNKGYNTIEEILKRTPGVNFVNNGFGYIVDVRGQGVQGAAKNVKVLVDGSPLNILDMSHAILPLNSISVEDIEKIEIINGGGTVLYGGGTAGGVINVITKKTQEEPVKNKIYYQNSSFDTNKFGFGTSIKFADNFLLDLAYENVNGNGYRRGDKRDGENLRGGFTYNIADNQTLRFKATRYKEESKESDGITKAQLNKDRKQTGTTLTESDLDRTEYSLNYEIKPTDNLTFSLLGYNQKTIRDYDQEAPAGRMTHKTDGQFKDRKTGVDLKGKYNYGLGNVIFGYEYIKNNSNRSSYGAMYMRNRRLFPTSTIDIDLQKNTHSAFVQGRHSFTDKLEGTLGYRYEHADYDIHRTDGRNVINKNTKKSNNAYETGLNFKYSDTGNVYAKYERGYRSPSPTEMVDKSITRGYVLNNLKSEKYDTYEIGIKDMIGPSFVSLTGFYTNKNDEILIDMPSGHGLNWTYKNLQKTERKGVELFAEQYFGTFRVNESVSYVDAKISKGADKNKKIPYVSKTKATLGANYEVLTGLNLTADLNYFSNSVDGNYEKIKGYSTTDLGVSYAHKTGLGVQAGVKNVFGKKYYRYKNGDSYIPEAERTYYVGVSYNF
ncbi:TonB-dependent receptor [Leptotrichia sp. oral taxon 879]|uniref:TonB-dependent receptor n=1 Tax=Leptotrichia sp. oral taxon 879 TaxID=1227267 RepID=UPI0003AE0A9D|nr:TonB-dependent receptor [Leptotrichia sp. oral taxon 879]ERK51139.1 outer membrane insertion signal domain protein [Leptotrichia sp. oral taxon 879 str. F0557]